MPALRPPNDDSKDGVFDLTSPEDQRPILSIPPSQVSLLIVDDDLLLLSALRRDIGRQGFSVHVASSAQEAIDVLRATRIDVMLTDLMLGGKDGMELIDEARRYAPDMRPILMSGQASSQDHDKALRLGAVRVLIKPFAPMEVLDAIRQAIDCEIGFRGSVHGLSLVDMLQMFHFGRRSVSISVTGAAVGTIHMRKGEFIHARSGALSGREALRVLLSGASGSVRTAALATTASTLTGGFDSILLDALRELDETSRRGSELEPTIAAEAAPGLDALASAIKREVPGAAAWLASEGRAEQLVGDEMEQCDPGGVLRVVGCMARLVPDWTVFEIVASGGSSIGVVRSSKKEGAVLVVWMDTSQTRAVQRFRSHFAKLCREISLGAVPQWESLQ